MNRIPIWIYLTSVVCLLYGATLSAADGRVSLELVTVGDFPFEQTRDWAMLFQKLGLEGVRIHSGTEDDVPEIVTEGSEKSPTYRVKGVLTPNGLILKGAKFKLSDRVAIGKWLDKLKEGGESGLTAVPGAFGLLPKELASVHEALATPLDVSTAGAKPKDLVDQLKSKISLTVNFDSGADSALASAEPFTDELQGVSSGTSLAALLRPAGLVFVPVKKGGTIELKITDSRSVEKSWPVGWPSDKGKGQLLPDLFKILTVEIDDTVPLEESLANIQKRVKAPFLYDPNALARQRVDLKTKVSLPKANLSYARILDKLLTKVKCKTEVRLDEADKPFVWITTLK